MLKLFKAAILMTTATVAAPAMAQDADPGSEFSGLYVGGSVGATNADNNGLENIQFDRDLNGEFGDAVTTTSGANAFSPGFCSGSVSGPSRPADGCESEDMALEFSGRVGYDYQMGGIVLGVVAEVGTTEAESSVTGFSTTPASYTFTREIDYIANLRARFGATVTPTTLVYGTAGGAYAKLDNSFTTTNTANSNSSSGSDDSFGFVLGAGVEQKIGRNFSVGIEYLYQQLEDDDFLVRLGPGTAPATNPFLLGNSSGTDLRRSDSTYVLNSLRAVANFRF